MSESSFPFGGPAEPDPADTLEAEEPGRRSPVVLVGALVGALVLGGGGFFLLGGSGDTEDAVVAAPVKRAAPAAAAPAPAPAPAAAAVPAASSEQVGRNPFKALFLETPAAPAGSSTSTTTSTATSGGTTTTGGTTTGTTGTTTGTTGTTGGTGTVTEIKTLTVELVRVDEATANADFVVTKSGEKTPVAGVQPGHDFGSYFRYIGWGWSDEVAGKRVQCARVLIGDALVDICQQDVHEVKTS